jgi:hypothetical protein
MITLEPQSLGLPSQKDCFNLLDRKAMFESYLRQKMKEPRRIVGFDNHLQKTEGG